MRHLILDLFGVVIGFDNDLVYRRYASRCREPVEARSALDGLMASREVITGVATLPMVRSRLENNLGLRMTQQEFDRAWLAPYSWSMPGMHQLLTETRPRFEISLLSNIDGYYWPVVREHSHELVDLIDHLFLSFEMRLAKPDPKIYERVVEDLKCSPEDCIFVDDTLANVRAAQEVGMAGFHFNSVSGLRHYLSTVHQ